MIRQRERSGRAGTAARGRSRLGAADGTQLIELALVLPVLLLLLLGGIEFARGFILKHKLTNAAREGARIAVQQPQLDLDESNPPTIQTVRNAVVEYLDGEGIDVSAMGTSPTRSNLEFTFTGGQAEIVIDRGVLVASAAGPAIDSTRVTVRYPFNWSLHRITQWAASSSSLESGFVLSTDVTMANIQ